MIEDAFPLCWPAGVARVAPSDRRRAAFAHRGDSSLNQLTVYRALGRLNAEIAAFTRRGHNWRINPEKVVVSMNLRVRKDGGPVAEQKEPYDPGAAVYFELDGERRCVASDKWDRVADNIAGIAAAIGALRGLERWVNDANVRAAFKGFLALPDPNRVDWRKILGVKNGDATPDGVRAAYRRLAVERHPDHEGGSEALMAELNLARDQALAEIAR